MKGHLGRQPSKLQGREDRRVAGRDRAGEIPGARFQEGLLPEKLLFSFVFSPVDRGYKVTSWILEQSRIACEGFLSCVLFARYRAHMLEGASRRYE
jgi:hypothetical protein